MGIERNDIDRLSELFELKRLEQPKPGFWETFDKQLDRKLIQAAVETRRPSYPGNCFTTFLHGQLFPVSISAAFVFMLLFGTWGSNPTQTDQPVIPGSGVHSASNPQNAFVEPFTVAFPGATSESAHYVSETFSAQTAENGEFRLIPVSRSLVASFTGDFTFVRAELSANSPEHAQAETFRSY